MKLEVKKRDIAQGVRCITSSCPVALAMLRKLGSEHTIMVQIDTFVIGRRDWFRFIPIPIAVRRIVAHYDLTGEMKPFSFRLGVETYLEELRDLSIQNS